MPNAPLEAMLVNVGGATAPAIHTLNECRPRYICFFVSKDSLPLVKTTILPALTFAYDHYDWIETPAPQSMLDCYRCLAERLPPILEKWGVPPQSLGVEYTAGTKPMSVTAVLATIDFCSQYFYTGASDPTGRDRGGIGVVLDGRESTWYHTNPWEALAIPARKEIALLFNNGRFAEARARLTQLAQLAPEDMGKVYQALAELIEGYQLWDRFDYRSAQMRLNKGLQALRLYVAGRDDPIRAWLDRVDANVQFLNRLTDKERSAGTRRLDEMDLLANAIRRANLAQRYDDAVARLYSLLELLARNRLQDAHGIRTSACRPDQIPAALRSDYVQRLGTPGKPGEPLKLGSADSYRLLIALGDPLGQKFHDQEDQLARVLSIRNQSRLAHGVDPVKPDTYQQMLEIIMAFGEYDERDLPVFPELKL